MFINESSGLGANAIILEVMREDNDYSLTSNESFGFEVLDSETKRMILIL